MKSLKKIFNEKGIKIIDGLGTKTQPSSYLTERANIHPYVEKPWGGYQDLLRKEDRVIKEIDVRGGESLSLQSHDNREEHWILVYGEGEVRLGDMWRKIKPGDYIYVPKKEKHTLVNNTGNMLKIVELQIGECSEEDIIRYEDRYGRVSDMVNIS